MSINPDNHPHNPLPHFWLREKRILKLISKGLNNHEISEEMFIAVRTVENMQQNILDKTDYKNIDQLINECLLQGLI